MLTEDVLVTLVIKALSSGGDILDWKLGWVSSNILT